MRWNSRHCVVVAGLAGVVLFGCQSDDEKLVGFMERADTYLEDEQFKEAIIEYRNALQLDPNNAAGHYGLAKAFLADRKARESFWELSETVRLDPENIEARLTFGGLSLASRDYDGALVQADGIIAIEPERSEAYMLRAQALQGLERRDESEPDLLKAIELEPERGVYHLLLAAYHQAKGDSEAAEAALLRYGEVDPGFRSSTALAQMLVGQPERAADAEAAFRAAIAQAEEDTLEAAYQNLAGFYFGQEDFEEVVATLEEGILKVEEKLDLIYLLARYHRTFGDEETSNELLEKATREYGDNPQTHLVLAGQLTVSGDLEGALAAVEAALAVAPDNVGAKLAKAELLIDLGYREGSEEQIAEARALVDGILDAEPSRPTALLLRAKLYIAAQDIDSAIAPLRQAIAARPDWAKAHQLLGTTLALKGDRSAARASLARAVELGPQLAEARRQLASIHAALGEHEYAIEQGRAYLETNPDHTAVRILVAQSLLRIGKREEAFAELGKIPEEDRSADSLFAIGRMHQARGEFDAARTHLVQAYEARPGHPEILRSLLQIDRAQQRVEESRKRIAEAVAADPESAKLAQLSGVVALDARDFAEAERQFKLATDLDPEDLSGYEQLAGLYRLQGRLDETASTLENALQQRPDSARLHHFLAILRQVEGQTDSAIEHYQSAIELDPQLGDSKNNLAYLLAERGEKLDQALNLAQEAKALLPDSANTADTLGWVLYKRGIPSAAVGYLREAVAGMDLADSNLGVVRHHLAQAYEANGEPERAIESLERALADLERRNESLRASGTEFQDPPWVAEVQAMIDRLQSGGTGTG